MPWIYALESLEYFFDISIPWGLSSFWCHFWGNEFAILTGVAEVTRLRVDGFTIRSLAAWFDGHPLSVVMMSCVHVSMVVLRCPEACSCQIHPSKVVWNTPSLECRCDPLGGSFLVHGCPRTVTDAVERSLGAGPGTEMNRQMRRRRHQVKGRNFYILLLQLSCHDVMFGSKAMTHEFFENVSRCLRCVGLNKLKFFRSARSGKWSENSASGKWGANSTTSNKWGANSSSGNKFGKSGSNIWNSASGRQYSNTGQPNWCFNELVGIHAISLS